MNRLIALYRRALALLPADMRERFGDAMVDTLRARLAGRAGAHLLATWVRAMADLVVQSAALRMEGLRADGASSDLAHDVRFALRGLTASPLVTASSVLTLGLGIGASTATFSVVKAALLESPPVPAPEELVVVWPEVNANRAMVELAREMMPSLADVSGMSDWTLTLTGAGEAREITAGLVNPSWFDLLGVPPVLGRAFDADADLPSESGVVVLSHGFWVDVFGADPSIVGRVVDIGGAEHDRRTVIGVMPAGVESVLTPVDVWVPLAGERALPLDRDNTWYVNERLARLRPGATLEQANREVAAYAAEVRSRIPDNFSEDDVRVASVQRLGSYLTRDVRGPLWATLGAVVLVLLIGCLNVANLQLARADRRRMDYAVRVALGAGAARMRRMLLARSLAVSGLAGLAGIALAWAMTDVLVRMAPEALGIGVDRVLDPGVLAFGLALSLSAGVLSGILPAVRVGRTRATAALGRAGRGGRGAASRWAHGLTAVQMALAVVVVIGSGLMLRSLDALFAVDTGIDGDGVVAFKPNPPSSAYPDAEAFRQYYQAVAERLAGLPFTESVGSIHLLLGTTSNWSFPTWPEGFVVPEGEPTPTVNFRAIGGDYLALAGIDLLSGRRIDDSDGADGEPVVVVNDAFVDEFWPDRDPLGAAVRFFSPTATPYRVVGVVESVHQHGRTLEARPELYFSYPQVPFDQMTLWMMVRIDPAAGEVTTVMPAIRDAVWSIDPDVPISGMTELSEALGRSTRRTEFLTALLTAFGGLALLLSMIGVFGTTAYVVGRRRSEFSLRLALGSTPAAILGSAIRGSLLPACVGLGIGLVVAARLAVTLGTVLYEVDVLDPATFVFVPIALVVTAAAAAALPALRASRVDPASALDDG